MARSRLLKTLGLNSIDPSDQFLRDLSTTIEKVQDNRKPSQTFKPSSMGSCKRNIYYQLTGVEPDSSVEDASLIGICDSGTDTHERIQTYISKMASCGFDCIWVDVEEFVKTSGKSLPSTTVKRKCGMETKLYDSKYNMSFLCDGVVKYRGEYYIIEIKTEMSRKFGTHDAPFSHHIEQATCYSLCLGIDKVIFLYINRDVHVMKTYLVDITDRLKQKVIDEIEEVNHYVTNGTLPPKETTKCAYCRYRSTCRRERE